MLIGEISWAAAVFFDRTSILALYIRIFRTKSFRMTCWAVIGINTAFFIATVLGATLICRPIALIWDHSIHAGWCGDQKSLDIFIGVFNLVMDVTVILLPMPVLWGLQMAVGKKLVLSGIFAVGIVYVRGYPINDEGITDLHRATILMVQSRICITTLVRIQISGENHGSNSQQVYSLVALLTCLEALLGVINACLPVMKPVFQKLGESKASGWVSSVMSGSIPIFLKRSQMATSRIADSEEIATWHGQKTVKTPPSRFFERRPSNMGFPLPPTDMNAHPVGPVDSTPPPVPPKSPTSKYNKPSPTARWEVEKKLGIVVQTDWDVERQDRVQSDRTPLKDKRENYSQW